MNRFMGNIYKKVRRMFRGRSEKCPRAYMEGALCATFHYDREYLKSLSMRAIRNLWDRQIENVIANNFYNH